MSDNTNKTTNDVTLIDLSVIADDVWKGFKGIWWFLLLVISVCASIFYFHVKIIYTPQYEASATYTVSSSTAYGYSETYYNQQTATGLATTLQYVLTSNVMNTVVAEDMGLESVPGTISVSVMENTNMITIAAKSSDAQTAYNILQSVIKTYPTVAKTVIGNTVLEKMDETGMPSAPSNPDWSTGAAKTGIIVGVVIDFFILLIFAMTKHTVRKEKDFEKLLNVKCIGGVPLARFKKRSKKAGKEVELVLMDNYRVPAGFVEAIRTIRTRFERNAQDKGQKIFLITSAIPGEGKSTISANIGLSLALKGKSVIVVDMDLRNPSLAEALNMTDYEYGCIDVLKQSIAMEDALLQYKDTKLRIIPGGKPIQNTSRLLTQEYMDEFIEKLRKMADYVILDTPPCAILSDAALVAKYAQGAVFVVRQDYARIDRILEGIQNLAESRVDIFGCILNEAEVGVTGYGYSNSYAYGRYGYGHGDKKYGYGYGGYGYGAQRTESAKMDAEVEESDLTK